MKQVIFLIGVILISMENQAQEKDPKATEAYEPVPSVVEPGNAQTPPSDAVILFDGSNFDQFEKTDGGQVEWEIKDNFMTVVPKTGSIRTKKGFGDCQLHIEWRSPEVVDGNGQGRGNSGVFLMGKYELQILDSYDNDTYTNGQAASIYKQYAPLVNACRKPGEWQTYDIIFTAPRFGEDGRMVTPARFTVLHNGVLVQNNIALLGPTEYIGIPVYQPHEDKLPIILQDHGDLVSFRNIWLREL